MLKKTFAFLALLTFVCVVGKGWHWAKDGFSIGRTYFPLGSSQPKEPDAESVSALAQPYRYLGRGHQCYAFESQDGRYVLKLPRYDRYEIPFWLKACSFSWLDAKREALWADKKGRLAFLLTSFEIAFRDLKEETAVLYLHLEKTDCLHQTLTVVDRLGRSYPLPLDQTAFVLQRKIPLMMPLFRASLEKGDREKAKEILTAFLKVVAIRSEKGIYNKDPSFLKNFGYSDRGIQIDIGSFYRKPQVANSFVPSFLQTMEHVKNWLSSLDPEMAAWFSDQTEQYTAKS